MSPTDKIAQHLLPAMQAHWHVYQQYLQKTTTTKTTATTTDESTNPKNWLRPYLDYRLAKDPARPMLQALYGKEWSEQVLESVLFPMDMLFSSQNQEQVPHEDDR